MHATVTQWIITQRHLVVTCFGSSPPFTAVTVQALWVKPAQHILSMAKLTSSHETEMLRCQMPAHYGNLLLAQQPPLLVQNLPFQTAKKDVTLVPKPRSQYMWGGFFVCLVVGLFNCCCVVLVCLFCLLVCFFNWKNINLNQNSEQHKWKLLSMYSTHSNASDAGAQ